MKTLMLLPLLILVLAIAIADTRTNDSQASNNAEVISRSEQPPASPIELTP